jgi:hypothetical protein
MHLLPGHLIKQIQIVLPGKYRYLTDGGDDELSVGLLGRKINDAITKKINPLAKIHRRWLNVKVTAVAVLTPEITWL